MCEREGETREREKSENATQYELMNFHPFVRADCHWPQNFFPWQLRSSGPASQVLFSPLADHTVFLAAAMCVCSAAPGASALPVNKCRLSVVDIPRFLASVKCRCAMEKEKKAERQKEEE